MKRRLPESQRRVRGLPRYDNPVDAVGHLSAACANSVVRGVILVTVDPRGNVETSVFGEVRSKDLCWSGAVLQNLALGNER